MIRTPRRITAVAAVAAAVVALSALLAAPASAWPNRPPAWRSAKKAVPAAPRANPIAAKGANRPEAPVYSVPRAAQCQDVFTAVWIPALGDFACVHPTNDPVVPQQKIAAGIAPIAPKCFGDGVTGPRVQLLYVYMKHKPNRAGQVMPKLHRIAAFAESAFRRTSKDQGREIGVRWHMPGCKLAVDVVGIEREEGIADRENPNQYGRIVNAVAKRGYNKPDRKYHIWFDGGSTGPCGVGGLIAAPAVGDNPTPVNPANLGAGLPLSPAYAVTFRQAFTLPDGLGLNEIDQCWGSSSMGAHTEVHEILHTLGAVQLSAPNSNGLGHCRDDHDIMCYPEGGVKTFVRCIGQHELLDCGADDYFNARPPLGSYLSTHWNVAMSVFLQELAVPSIPGIGP